MTDCHQLNLVLMWKHLQFSMTRQVGRKAWDKDEQTDRHCSKSHSMSKYRGPRKEPSTFFFHGEREGHNISAGRFPDFVSEAKCSLVWGLDWCARTNCQGNWQSALLPPLLFLTISVVISLLNWLLKALNPNFSLNLVRQLLYGNLLTGFSLKV